MPIKPENDQVEDIKHQEENNHLPECMNQIENENLNSKKIEIEADNPGDTNHNQIRKGTS